MSARDTFNEYHAHRVASAEAVKPVLESHHGNRALIECYANAEYWAGWNTAIMHAARVARDRHNYWQESTLGNSCPDDDVSACDDVARAIEFSLHRKPPDCRPQAASGIAVAPASETGTGSTEGKSPAHEVGDAQ